MSLYLILTIITVFLALAFVRFILLQLYQLF